MKSPWKWSSTVEPEREYLVLASSIPPRSRRSTFQLFRGAQHSSQATGNHRRRDRLLATGSPTCQAIRHAVGVARRGRPRRLCRDRAAPWADDQAEPGDGSDEIRALDHAGICRSTVVGRCAPTPELISIGAVVTLSTGVLLAAATGAWIVNEHWASLTLRRWRSRIREGQGAIGERTLARSRKDDPRSPRRDRRTPGQGVRPTTRWLSVARQRHGTT